MNEKIAELSQQIVIAENNRENLVAQVNGLDSQIAAMKKDWLVAVGVEQGVEIASRRDIEAVKPQDCEEE